MAEQVKQEEKRTDAKKAFSAVLKVILGLVFLVLGILAVVNWWQDLLLVVRGCIGLFLALAAVVTFAIAKE